MNCGKNNKLSHLPAIMKKGKMRQTEKKSHLYDINQGRKELRNNYKK